MLCYGLVVGVYRDPEGSIVRIASKCPHQHAATSWEFGHAYQQVRYLGSTEWERQSLFSYDRESFDEARIRLERQGYELLGLEEYCRACGERFVKKEEEGIRDEPVRCVDCKTGDDRAERLERIKSEDLW